MRSRARFRFAPAALALAAALGPALPGTTLADEFNWTGLGIGSSATSWSFPLNWSPPIPPTGTDDTDRLVFSQTDAAVENDVRAAFVLNRLTKSSASGNVTVSGQSLRFGGASPALVVAGGTLTLFSTLTGSSSVSKTGTGRLTLGGSGGDFAGVLSVLSGTLETFGSSPLGPTARVFLADGARFTSGSTAEYGGFSGGGRVELTAAASLRYGSDASFLGQIQGAGTFIKRGAGTFTMLGQSTATGRTVVSEGRIALSGRGAAWAGGDIEVANGTTVTVNEDAAWHAGSGRLQTGGGGSGEPARIVIGSGGQLSTGAAALSSRSGNRTEITVSGLGTNNIAAAWLLDGDLSLGGSGHATLDVGSGGIVRATGAASIANGSRLRLDGGLFEAASIAFATGSFLDWTSGTLRVTGTQDTQFGALVPGAVASLVPGKTLSVAGRLVLGPGAGLHLAGGALATGEVVLRSASLTTAPNHALALGSLARIEGSGEVRGRYGHLPEHTLSVDGGELTLTDTEPGTLVFDGSIHVASSGTLVVADTSTVELRGEVTLEADARLRSANGLRLSGRHMLTAIGGGRIDGPFINASQVQGGRDADHPLEFAGTVGGRGGYGGYILISGIHGPGESFGRTAFQHVEYAPSATLRMEIGGFVPMTEHDIVVVIGTAALGGMLEVIASEGFAFSAGDAFTLMTYGVREGTFAGLSVTGLGPDLSASLTYGDRDLVLRIAPVPETETWALLTLGLALVARRRARRGR